ncbi:hypothetical protein F5146DRAFT_1140762 [Armillaria mellea]|nr:hypothetical protein F5146DRAFT_1140762 [Armillaria mellea]
MSTRSGIRNNAFVSTRSVRSANSSIMPPISKLLVELLTKIFLCTKDGPLKSGQTDSNRIRVLEFATALETVSISGLPWRAVFYLDTLSLTDFEEHHISIKANVLDTWIALLPFARNLSSMAMWCSDILGVVHGRRSHAVLPKVISFSSGSIDVFDAVTLPKLALLSLSTISSHVNPMTLMAARHMLDHSNSSPRLQVLEISNIPLTSDLLSIFDLSHLLNQVTIKIDSWTLETDALI